MIFTDEYLTEQKKCVSENTDFYYRGKFDIPTKVRLQILKDFCKYKKNIISVGCSGYEPIFLNSSVAVDICPLANDYLKIHGYKGQFVFASCDNLPFQKDQFDCAVCSEVIEHLPTLDDVKNTFLELDRIATSFIVDTPNVDKIKKEYQYPGHTQFWNEDDLKKIIPSELLPKLKIYTKSLWIVVEKNVA